MGSFINGDDKGVGIADHQQCWSEESMRVKYILHIAGDATHILFLCMGCTPIGIVLYILHGESKIIQWRPKETAGKTELHYIITAWSPLVSLTHVGQLVVTSCFHGEFHLRFSTRQQGGDDFRLTFSLGRLFEFGCEHVSITLVYLQVLPYSCNNSPFQYINQLKEIFWSVCRTLIIQKRVQGPIVPWLASSCSSPWSNQILFVRILRFTGPFSHV